MDDLETINRWALQWKMLFNPDITKQAIEVIFSSKYKKCDHPNLVFNGIPVARRDSTIHLGVILDEKLSFRKHILEAIVKAKKGLSLMKFLAKYINREKLEITYKMYVRPYLEYGDIIFHNCSLDTIALIESIQYQAGLIVSGCWKGTSRIKLYEELGWESLSDRRSFHRLALYYKIKSNEAPSYLNPYVLVTLPSNSTDRYKRTFFPFCLAAWDCLDQSLRNAESLNEFKLGFIKTIRPLKKGTHKITDIYGLKLLTRLRVDFSDLREHRFNHKFNCPDPTCACGLETETTEHYLLRCPRFASMRTALLSSIAEIINPGILHLPHAHLTEVFLFGSNAYNEISNRLILEASIRFIKTSLRFKSIEAFL